jgi:hypothetical protein
MKLLRRLNAAVTRNLRTTEMVGVLMRIFSFSLVSWLGPASPFLFVWAFNTTDAILLSWCAIIKRDSAYTVLNVFWVGVGVVGMVRAAGLPRHESVDPVTGACVDQPDHSLEVVRRRPPRSPALSVVPRNIDFCMTVKRTRHQKRTTRGALGINRKHDLSPFQPTGLC